MALYKRTRPTHCRSGHEYTEANTVWIASTRTFDGRTRNCRQCNQAKLQRRYAEPGYHERQRAKTQAWRKANPEQYRDSWQRAHEQKKQILLDARANGCIRCTEKHPACLDFHHRDGKKNKLGHIGFIRRFGLDRLYAEIAKCDVICANCHRKLHWDERQSVRTATQTSDNDI